MKGTCSTLLAAVLTAFGAAGARAVPDVAASASPVPKLTLSPILSPTISPTPGALSAWGRIQVPEGLDAGTAPAAEAVKYLIKVNNLLIGEPEALDAHPEAARSILTLLSTHEADLAAKKVKTLALRRLIQGAGLAPTTLVSPVSPAGSPDLVNEKLAAFAAQINQRLGALEASSQAQAETAVRHKEVSEFLSQNLADLSAKQKASEEAVSKAQTIQASLTQRVDTQETRVQALEASAQKLTLDTASAKEAAEAGKTGMAGQQVLLERLSSDLEKTGGQVKNLEQEKETMRQDLAALQELLKVGQTGTADIREDIQYLRNEVEKKGRQEEAVRKERAPGILRHPALPGAAFVIAIAALIVAL